MPDGQRMTWEQLAKANSRCRCVDLAAENEKLRGMLKKVEWVEDNFNYVPLHKPICPICDQNEPDGHLPDCDLNAAKKEGGE